MVCLLHCALSEPPAKRACVGEERSIMQPSACACPACMRSTLSCDVRVLGEEIQHASLRVRFVLREMRKCI